MFVAHDESNAQYLIHSEYTQEIEGGWKGKA
jgi:hypothetical protein